MRDNYAVLYFNSNAVDAFINDGRREKERLVCLCIKQLQIDGW